MHELPSERAEAHGRFEHKIQMVGAIDGPPDDVELSSEALSTTHGWSS